MRSLLSGLVLLALGVAAQNAPVEICHEHHGFAGEDAAKFTLNAAVGALTAEQRLVLFARALSPEGSVQLSVGGHMYAADEPVIMDVVPPSPVNIEVLGKNMDLTPFTFVSYVANSESCRLPLTSANLAVPLVAINGQPATAYFYAAPVQPFNFFTVSISSPAPVTSVYRYDLTTSLDQGIVIPTNSPISGQTSNMNAGVYIAAKSGSPEAIDAVRLSVVWSVPPPGWTAPEPPTDNNWKDGALSAAATGGSFLGSFLVTMIMGFVAYMLVRSVYNYRVLGITTYPEFVPHREFFGTAFERVNSAADTVRARTNIPGVSRPGEAEPVNAGGPSIGGSTRRGYEYVGGSQP